MIDANYLKDRTKILKDIKRLTRKDYSGQYPVIEISSKNDDEGIEKCLRQIEAMEKLAAKLVESMM
jgi:hypothetical protein